MKCLGITIKLKLNLYKEAEKDFTQCIEIEPKYSSAYYNRAETRFKLKHYIEAIEDYNKSEELGNVTDDLYFHRGFSRYKTSDYENAVIDFDKTKKNIKVTILKFLSKFKSLFVKKKTISK